MDLHYSDEVPEDEGLFIMGVGEHGSGKTWMIRTWNRSQRPQ